jgi:hypothetical protein
MQLYKQIHTNTENSPIKVLYGPNNTFTECHSNGELVSWRRLLSGYYIKLSRDWVPAEVIHHQFAPPLQTQVLEGESGDELLVQRWIQYSSNAKAQPLKVRSDSSLPSQVRGSAQQVRPRQHPKQYQSFSQNH